ncbi:hypothetical protein GCM10008933_23430 [Paenibacillus motobuensis]|uniref:Uncharacterized protein n=1 Tax=Paenibacillus motobuensis TaxID=295324 RepID=A0ABP3I5W2_9BACL
MRQKTHDCLGSNALAAAGFADYSDGFAWLNMESDAAHGLHLAAADMEGYLEILDF